MAVGDERWRAAQAEVFAAYALHDSYSAEDRATLEAHAKRARALLDDLEPEIERSAERARLWYLRGKVLDASPSYSAESEALLTRAVKLDPANIDAWNTLAECLWKGGRLELARTCYLEALARERNADSLCQLSMLLRTMGNRADATLVLESLRLAKEAVALDVSCGRAWYVLGNAYLSSYFVPSHERRLDPLHSALKAYRRAAHAPTRPQAGCADLHYNKAIVQQYLLEYAESLDAFAEAHKLAPELSAHAQRRALLGFVKKCADSVQARGHLPKKRLQQLERALRAPPPAELRAIAELRAGANAAACLRGAVVAELVPEAQTPLCYVLLDRAGDTVLLCVYNTVPGAIQVYQTVEVHAPHLRQVDVPDAGAFACVVVEDPLAGLLVQGRPLERSQVGRARVTNTAEPAAAVVALADVPY